MIQKIRRKTFKIRESGRSTDFISPSFGHGCLYDCSYCYMKRHKPKGLTVATNTGDILTEVNNHAYFSTVEKPNQTHADFVTYDISCNEDFALHAKYHEWERIFEFFKDHPIAMGSFATKYVNKKLLSFNPEGKIRIRFSLMPQKMADIHEPNTSKIIDRIKAINTFIEAEVIFLTHNFKKHIVNTENHPETEITLWKPEIQETKISQYGGENIRYEYRFKRKSVKQFKELHNEIIPWNTIRYIF